MANRQNKQENTTQPMSMKFKIKKTDDGWYRLFLIVEDYYSHYECYFGIWKRKEHAREVMNKLCSQAVAASTQEKNRC